MSYGPWVRVRLFVPAVCVAMAAACGRSPAPASPSVSPAVVVVPIVSIQAPVPVGPSDGALEAGPELTVVNAARTGPIGSLLYEFEVATNATFASVFSFAAEPEGQMETATRRAWGPTGTVVYWRARAVDVATGHASAYSVTRSFTTRSGCTTFEPPAPLAPDAGATVSLRPTFRIRSGKATGLVGAAGYRLEVSKDARFRSVAITAFGSVFLTSLTLRSDLEPGVVYYWRARMENVKVCAAVGAFSDPQSFVTTGS